MKHTNIYAKYSCLLLVFLMLAFLLPLRAFSDDATHETVRVGFFAFDGYHMIDDNGIRSGYGYDFLQLAARYLDINYDYIGYDKSWEDMQQMLLNGEIDLLTSAQKTPDRENDFAYSRPIGTSCGIMTVSSSNTSIIAKDYTTYEGIRVGLLKNNSRNDDFAKLAAEKGFTYVPIYFDMADEMDDALLDGKIDAAVSSSLRRTAQERIVEEFATSNFYAIVRKDDTDLLNKINYAIDQMNAVEGDWENTLNNKYYTHLESKNLAFTNQELALLHEYSDGGKTLKITCSTDRAPYSYLEDGKVKGILPDYFEQIANYAGFNYEYLIPSSREELHEWQLNNTADIYIDARLPYEQWVEDHGGMITAPYVTMKLAMVTRRDFSGDIKKISVAEEQGTYGIEENLATDAERIAVPTREEALQAVLNGKVDATFVYLYSAQEFVNRDERGLLTYTALESPSYQYRMVVSKNVSHTWAGILTKCIYKHLLLVEDNELNLEIEVTILESAGFRVTTAENGAEAVEKVRSALNDPYDAVLMDIQMPVMDGYEASRQIRHLEDKRLSQIPIIAVSANAFEEDVNASLAAGMNGHIAKPISVDKLFALLKKTLA